MLRQKCADTLPQIIQTALAPVARLNKTAAKLDTLIENMRHRGVVMKQTIAIQSLAAFAIQLFAGRHETISAYNFQLIVVP